jgi:hypothetical protein
VQKFSSNVVEKCLELANDKLKVKMIEELINPERLPRLLQDPYANYVIQKALSVSKKAQFERLVAVIKPHLLALRNTSFGKRIQSKILKKFPDLQISLEFEQAAGPGLSLTPVMPNLSLTLPLPLPPATLSLTTPPSSNLGNFTTTIAQTTTAVLPSSVVTVPHLAINLSPSTTTTTTSTNSTNTSAPAQNNNTNNSAAQNNNNASSSNAAQPQTSSSLAAPVPPKPLATSPRNVQQQQQQQTQQQTNSATSGTLLRSPRQPA